MPTTKIKIELESNIAEMIQYFKDILDSTFHGFIKEKYESPTNMNEVLMMGISVMDWVYAIHTPVDPSRRNYWLYESVKVSSDFEADAMGSLALWSDPNIASSVGDSSLSYAAYFIEPEAFGKGTFISPKGIKSYPVNFRPFFEQWEQLFDTMHTKFAEKALRETLQEPAPKKV